MSSAIPAVAEIDSLFADYTVGATPGVAVTVLRGEEVVSSNTYGTADLSTSVPITSSSVFSLASVSKQFTAYAVLLLEQDGELSLDDDVRRHVPELPDYGVAITLRHMIGHTAGLRSVLQLLGMTGLGPSDAITEEMVRSMILRQQKLNFAPGERFSYSNSGYVLLAEVVERTSGMSFADFTRQRILEPLGMHDSFVMIDPTRPVENLARSYSYNGTSYSYVPADYSYGGSTGLFTTLDDLALWVRHLGRPANEGALSRMQDVVLLSDGRSTGYAMGLFVEERASERFVHHAGSDAGYVAFVGWFPERDLGVALLSNTTATDAQGLALQVADLFLESGSGEPGGSSREPVSGEDSAAEPIELTDDQLALHAGSYLDTESYVARRVTVRDGSLIYARPEQGGRETTLEPLAEARFRMQSAPEVGIVFDRIDDARRMQVVEAGAVLESYVEISSRRPTAAQWEAAAGRYFSKELQTEYRMTVRDGRLTVHVPNLGAVALEAVGGDAFVAPGYPFGFLEIERSAGAVSGFRVSTPRAQAVSFTRAAAD